MPTKRLTKLLVAQASVNQGMARFLKKFANLRDVLDHSLLGTSDQAFASTIDSK